MMVVKEPVEDKLKTTTVLFGLVLLLAGTFFWKIMDLSNQVDASKRESKEDILLLTDDLNKTQKRIIDMQAENQNTNSAIEKVKGEITSSKDLVAEISKNIAALKTQTKKLSDNQAKSSKTEAEFKKTQENLTAALAKLDASNAELNRLKNQAKEMNQTITDLTTQLDDIKQRIDSKSVPPSSVQTIKKPWWKFWSN